MSPDEIPGERVKLVRNERTKLTATYLNGLAIAIVAVGFFSPAFGPTPSSPSQDALLLQALTSFLCLTVSATLHVIARLILGALR